MSRTKGSGWGGGVIFYQVFSHCGKKKAYYDYNLESNKFKCTYCKKHFSSDTLIRKMYASELLSNN